MDAKPAKWGGHWANAFIYGFSEFTIEVRGLVDLSDDWESDFTMLEQTGARTWEVPAAKEEEPAPDPHFFRVVIP